MSHLTTREVADFLGVETWRVQRVFEQGSVPEPQRFAGKRAIPRSMIPALITALQTRGWLPVEQEATA